VPPHYTLHTITQLHDYVFGDDYDYDDYHYDYDDYDYYTTTSTRAP
jgi:hypothetical protein